MLFSVVRLWVDGLRFDQPLDDLTQLSCRMEIWVRSPVFGIGSRIRMYTVHESCRFISQQSEMR